MQDDGVGDMIPPRDTKNGAKASEMKCIEPVFLAAVCAPRLAAVWQNTQDASGVDLDL